MTRITRPLAEYFPEINLPEQPLADWAVVQLRKIFENDTTSFGLILPGDKSADEKNQEEWHETMAKVVAIGPVFQKNRDTLEPWPECKDSKYTIHVGDIIRVPEFLSNRFNVRTQDGADIKCLRIRDNQITGKVTDVADAMDRVKAYIPLTERRA